MSWGRERFDVPESVKAKLESDLKDATIASRRTADSGDGDSVVSGFPPPTSPSYMAGKLGGGFEFRNLFKTRKAVWQPAVVGESPKEGLPPLDTGSVVSSINSPPANFHVRLEVHEVNGLIPAKQDVSFKGVELSCRMGGQTKWTTSQLKIVSSICNIAFSLNYRGESVVHLRFVIDREIVGVAHIALTKSLAVMDPEDPWLSTWNRVINRGPCLELLTENTLFVPFTGQLPILPPKRGGKLSAIFLGRIKSPASLSLATSLHPEGLEQNLVSFCLTDWIVPFSLPIHDDSFEATMKNRKKKLVPRGYTGPYGIVKQLVLQNLSPTYSNAAKLCVMVGLNNREVSYTPRVGADFIDGQSPPQGIKFVSLKDKLHIPFPARRGLKYTILVALLCVINHDYAAIKHCGTAYLRLPYPEAHTPVIVRSQVETDWGVVLGTIRLVVIPAELPEPAMDVLPNKPEPVPRELGYGPEVDSGNFEKKRRKAVIFQVTEDTDGAGSDYEEGTMPIPSNDAIHRAHTIKSMKSTRHVNPICRTLPALEGLREDNNNDDVSSMGTTTTTRRKRDQSAKNLDKFTVSREVYMNMRQTTMSRGFIYKSFSIHVATITLTSLKSTLDPPDSKSSGGREPESLRSLVLGLRLGETKLYLYPNDECPVLRAGVPYAGFAHERHYFPFVGTQHLGVKLHKRTTLMRNKEITGAFIDLVNIAKSGEHALSGAITCYGGVGIMQVSIRMLKDPIQRTYSEPFFDPGSSCASVNSRMLL